MVHAMVKRCTRNGESVSSIKRIQSLVDTHEVVRMEHVYRKSNTCVDALANVGCILDSK